LSVPVKVYVRVGVTVVDNAAPQANLKIPEWISVLYVTALYVVSGVIFSDGLSSPVA